MSSQFQPDHKGKHRQVSITPGMTVAHSSSREHVGEHNEVHGYTGGKPPKPKHGNNVTPVHGGMHRVVQGQPVTGGGSHAAYLDSLTGATVPGPVKSAPGWGNATARSGNPMVHAPASKVTKVAPIHPSMSKGAQHDQMLADLGRSILTEACQAHRGK